MGAFSYTSFEAANLSKVWRFSKFLRVNLLQVRVFTLFWMIIVTESEKKRGEYVRLLPDKVLDIVLEDHLSSIGL